MPMALPWPCGLGTAPRKDASSSSSSNAHKRRNLSEPTIRRVWSLLRASDQTSFSTAIVWRHNCTSTFQMRTKRSFDALIRRSPRNTSAVTWSTCPLKRARPLSPTVSQTEMSVSQPPEAKRCPSRENARLAMPDLCPWKVCCTTSSLQSLTEPSEYPTAHRLPHVHRRVTLSAAFQVFSERTCSPDRKFQPLTASMVPVSTFPA
mmetsp:Transcript_19652/g.52414  ORF Transcript_19652/g.52414 Transcript_19652/m.52414 type:complete len:205 (-) Transcript_19652:110-724(-)